MSLQVRIPVTVVVTDQSLVTGAHEYCFFRYSEGLPAGAAITAHHQDSVPGRQGHDDPTTLTHGFWPPGGPEHGGAAVLSAAPREGNSYYSYQ